MNGKGGQRKSQQIVLLLHAFRFNTKHYFFPCFRQNSLFCPVIVKAEAGSGKKSLEEDWRKKIEKHLASNQKTHMEKVMNTISHI